MVGMRAYGPIAALVAFTVVLSRVSAENNATHNATLPPTLPVPSILPSTPYPCQLTPPMHSPREWQPMPQATTTGR